MKDSNYPGADEAEPSTTDSEVDESKDMDKDSDGETALLPKSFFEGQELKPGQQYYVEIVRCYEDECEVRYPHKVKDEGSDANDKLDAMGTEMGSDNPGSEY